VNNTFWRVIIEPFGKREPCLRLGNLEGQMWDRLEGAILTYARIGIGDAPGESRKDCDNYSVGR
jgi:hypothetical protein